MHVLVIMGRPSPTLNGIARVKNGKSLFLQYMAEWQLEEKLAPTSKDFAFLSRKETESP